MTFFADFRKESRLEFEPIDPTVRALVKVGVFIGGRGKNRVLMKTRAFYRFVNAGLTKAIDHGEKGCRAAYANFSRQELSFLDSLQV